MHVHPPQIGGGPTEGEGIGGQFRQDRAQGPQEQIPTGW